MLCWFECHYHITTQSIKLTNVLKTKVKIEQKEDRFLCRKLVAWIRTKEMVFVRGFFWHELERVDRSWTTRWPKSTATQSQHTHASLQVVVRLNFHLPSEEESSLSSPPPHPFIPYRKNSSLTLALWLADKREPSSRFLLLSGSLLFLQFIF